MPIYEYYCRTCNEKFTQLRSMSAASANGRCDQGHKAMKVLTNASIAVAGAFADSEDAEAASASTGGGCACGRGSCGCGAGGPSLN